MAEKKKAASFKWNVPTKGIPPRFTQETTVCIVHMGALVFASCTPKPGRVL